MKPFGILSPLTRLAARVLPAPGAHATRSVVVMATAAASGRRVPVMPRPATRKPAARARGQKPAADARPQVSVPPSTRSLRWQAPTRGTRARVEAWVLVLMIAFFGGGQLAILWGL